MAGRERPVTLRRVKPKCLRPGQHVNIHVEGSELGVHCVWSLGQGVVVSGMYCDRKERVTVAVYVLPKAQLGPRTLFVNSALTGALLAKLENAVHVLPAGIRAIPRRKLRPGKKGEE